MKTEQALQMVKDAMGDIKNVGQAILQGFKDGKKGEDNE